MSDLEVKVQSLLVVAEALAFLVLALWCATRLGPPWAGLGLGGGLLLGLSTGLSAAGSFELVFLQSTLVYDTLFAHDHVSTVLVVAQALGASLLVLAFLQRHGHRDALR